jgi:hypothetical protein
MAPEVLQALPTQPPDMWSIGVLLYFLLVWTDAFADQSAASSRTNMSRIPRRNIRSPQRNGIMFHDTPSN